MSKKKTTVVTTITVDKNLDTHYLLILDRSGSMSSVWDETIEGLNEQLGTIRGLEEKYPEQRYFVSLVTFDDYIDTIFEDKPISEIENFNGTEFPPRGMTALHDGIGTGISNLKSSLKKKELESDSISTALVVVMTDGGENASKEYSSASIKEIITDLEKNGGWTFSFMGANQDAVLTASNFGINAGNTVTYKSTKLGSKVAFDTLNNAIFARAAASNDSYMSLASVGNVTLDNLDLKNTTFFSDVVDDNELGETE